MLPYILTGGEGTRLRPLTSYMPKPLVRIAGETALERLLGRLREAGYRRAVLCTCFRSDDIRAALGGSRRGVRLRYADEKIPLGTAGAVRAAWSGGDVLVLSGDSVCGTDYRAAAEFHASKNADVTIVAKRVDDPREYGLITSDADCRVTGFIEKPGYDSALTDLANTGAYILSEEIMRRIPAGEKLDFAKDVFPELLREGKRLFVFEDAGYWYDVGDIPSLLRCQRELLLSGGHENLIAEDAFIAEGAFLSSGTVAEKNVSVGRGARVLSSLICENSSVAADADICEAVICKNVTAGERLIMKRFSAIGEGSTVGSDVTVCEGVRIAPHTKIPDGAVIRTDIPENGFSPLYFNDGGEVRGVLGAYEALRLGLAAGKALSSRKIAVGGSGSDWEAVALGLRASGTEVFRLDGASFGETVYCARLLGCGFCFHVSETVRLLSPKTGGLTNQEERAVVRQFEHGADIGESLPNRLINAEAAQRLYVGHLAEIAPERPSIRAGIITSDPREKSLFESLIPDGGGERAVFKIADDRTTVTAVCGSVQAAYEELLLLCCKAEFSRHKSVCLPKSAPASCEVLAKETRSGVLRGGELSGFCLDPLELCFTVIKYVSERGIPLSEAIAELPKAFYVKRVIETDSPLPRLLREGFPEARAGEDITVETQSARGTVTPRRSGRGIRLYVESTSQEAADELCADILKRIERFGHDCNR